MPAVQIFLYLSILVLIIGVTVRTIRIAKMPAHLRWDLYPIPHEKGKAVYGGSYYEESNWWLKPREVSLTSEIAEMSKEIFGIQSLYKNNRTLWYFSYPFHIGLYLLTGFIGLLFLGAILQAAGIEIGSLSTGFWGNAIFILMLFSGITGWILGLIGALGLLIMRASRAELRNYSTRSDYFNLLLLLALFASGIVSWITVDKSFGALGGFITKLITFKPAHKLPPAVSIQLILTGVFFIYLPFTHMTHFVGKFFTYHRVRWQDDPLPGSGKLESAIASNLTLRQSWAAKHIRQNESWGTTVSEPPKSTEDSRNE